MRAMMSPSVSHVAVVGNDSGEDSDGHARRHSDSSCGPSMRRTPVCAAYSTAPWVKELVVTTIISWAPTVAFAPWSFCTTGLPTWWFLA